MSWDREGRYGREEREEALLRRGRPAPGKRSLTHSVGVAFGELPAPGKVPATLNVTDEGGGAAPDPAVRARVEATTGADLSAARVHTGASAQDQAAGLRARAFTVGSDIHFAAGQYRPGTPAGDRLLAHELAHAAQQRGAPAGPQLKASDVSQEGDAAELEADRIAEAAVSGAGLRIAPVARAAAVSRAPETLSGNPADLKDASGAPTTSHRSIGVGDAANAPKAPAAAGSEAKKTNVKPVATELAPLHVDGVVCPLDSAIFEEDATAGVPPAGFETVTGFSGTTALPMVEQVASKSLYIGGKPTADDVQQGGIGDCNFMAAVASIASSDPGKITSMMAPDGNGGATVTFWRAQASTTPGKKRDWIQVAVTVNDQLAVNISDNRVHGAQLRCAPNPRSQDWWAKVVAPNLEVHRKDTFEVARWAPLLEKAYARFAQSHDQYGGAHPGGKKGGSGYEAIFGGLGLEVFFPFYGPQMDDPANKAGFAVSSFTPGTGNIVAANATVMEHLLVLQGRKPDDKTAPVVTALTMDDALIRNLAAAIPVAQADPDYANVDPARQTLVASVATSITTWQGLPPDPSPPAAQPKATARTAIGTSCVDAVRPGIDESTGEQTKLSWMRQWVTTPIQFGQSSHALAPADATRMKQLHDELGRWASPVVEVHLDGHGSSEGSQAVNQRVSQERVDAVETAITSHGATPPHKLSKTAHGEKDATPDPTWRRVDVTITPTGHKTNSLLDDKRSQPIKDVAALMINLRNLGTDSSQGQRNVYGGHAYAVIAVNIVTSDGKNVPLSSVPAANRAALYPMVDADVSTVTLRNPHHGNEPDWKDSNKPYRPGDGEPSSASADGVFTMSLRSFFRDFNSINSGVFPKS